MLDFDAIINKHSECLVQQLVDTWERYNNVRHESPVMLEERWEIFMRETSECAVA